MAHPKVVDSAGMLRAERDVISARRDALGQPSEKPCCLGVSLSGGGIRSGTFNLGILQGIAQAGLLPCIDYLSTVSGGGYIGTWLHALIKRRGGGDPRSVTEVLERPDVHPHEEMHDPISFLRKFSSYLAPDVGLLSADTWVIGVIWIRNMFLNQLILVPFLACLSLLVFLLACSAHWYAGSASFIPGLVELLVAAGILAVVVNRAGAGMGATTFLHHECDDEKKQAEASSRDSIGNAVKCSVLVLIACFLLAASSGGLRTKRWESISVGWPLLAVLGGMFLSIGYWFFQHAGKFKACYRAQHGGTEPPWPLRLALFFIPGQATGFLFFGIARLASGWSPPQAVAWATPLFALAILTGVSILVGLMGIDYPDESREWLARLGALISIFAFAWAVLFTVAVFAPLWIAQLTVWSWPLIAGLGTGWIITLLGGIFAGKSANTSGSPNQPQAPAVLRIITAIAPSAFVVGYVLLISFGLHQGIIAAAGVTGTPSGNKPIVNSVVARAEISGDATAHIDLKSGSGSAAPAWAQTIAATEMALIDGPGHSCLWAIGFFMIGGVMVWWLPMRINVNEFSLYHFYKNRLVRCYLGATRKNRTPSRLTGFDSCDDIPLSKFLPSETDKYYGPFPIINTCLNLNTGSELAKAERKGTSFVFTPLYSGFVPPRSGRDEEEREKPLPQIRKESFMIRTDKPEAGGFRLTENYLFRRKGPDIGTCMAISGAAANPNGGYHTSSAMAFLMTMFDVRLGFWAGNPRLEGPSKEPGPRHALLALLSELFAQTNSTSNFLNLSDGGHFENLGLYELVHRRCPYIVVCDGEQDENYTFESLGGAVRKCRSDFGVEIDIDPRRIHPGANGLSGTHCVVGRVRYPETGGEEAFTGWLLYLKASLTGDEPEDIAQYKSSHADFPQQTTADQFFTESQFESYRKLGLHVWESAVQNMDPKSFRCETLHDFFECLYRTWYPPTDVPAGVGSKHAETYSALVNRLSDPALAPLMDQIVSPVGKPSHAISTQLPDRVNKDRAFLYVLELIQLMENVWGDLQMYGKSNRESPANGGWVTVFHHWTHQPIFVDAWERARYTFNPLFRQFYETLAKADVSDPPADTCGKLPWDLKK
jgi:hypothetical protein